MVVIAQLNLWFKFKLVFVGSKLGPLEPPESLEERRLKEDNKRNYLGILDENVELNLKVFSRFHSEFICKPLAAMEVSSMQQCFCKYMFPLPSFLVDNNDIDDSHFTGCTYGEPECICFASHNYYD